MLICDYNVGVCVLVVNIFWKFIIDEYMKLLQS